MMNDPDEAQRLALHNPAGGRRLLARNARLHPPDRGRKIREAEPLTRPSAACSRRFDPGAYRVHSTLLPYLLSPIGARIS